MTRRLRGYDWRFPLFIYCVSWYGGPVIYDPLYTGILPYAKVCFAERLMGLCIHQLMYSAGTLYLGVQQQHYSRY